MALIEKLENIGDAIRTVTKETDKYTLDQMAEKIEGFDGALIPTEEMLTITGQCYFRFAYNYWNWFIKTFGDKITTNNVYNLSNMFAQSTDLQNIPFTINPDTFDSINMSSMFSGCYLLKTLPTISACKAGNTDSIFKDCSRLEEIPEGYGRDWDWSAHTGATSSYGYNKASMLHNCYSLRRIRDWSLWRYNNNKATYSYTFYYNGFAYCHSLNDLLGIPVAYENQNSNMFSNTFRECNRLNHLTFHQQPVSVGVVTPYIATWKNQTINLSDTIGYAANPSNLLNRGFTEETRMTDYMSFSRLHANIDSWTTDPRFSRYNKRAAVETINSLPDTSAYLAEQGGTNTIKFFGDAGLPADMAALVDPGYGKISTLTEEEIAVAAAKGWTVTIV